MQLKIEKQESKLNGIKLTEIIDMKILNKLLKSSLLQTVSYEVCGITYDNEKHLLELIKKKVKNNQLIVNYKRPNYNFGRVNPIKSLGLCCIKRLLH